MTPRLLSDAVSRVLTDHGLEVVIHPDELTKDDCDVVVTSAEFLAEESGVIVAVLPGPRAESALRAHHRAPARVRSLDQLMAAIRVFIDTVATS